jgi:type I restriction enzyme S subunit
MDINKTSYIDWSTVPYCPISDKDRAKFEVLPGDVFVIRMADPGKVGICEGNTDAVFASYLVRLRPSSDQILPYFLFFTLSDEPYQSWVTGASTGATRKSVSAKVMTEPLISLPPDVLQAEFTSVVTPLRSLLSSTLDRIAALRSTRDLLLPRLVSGRIDVSDLDLDLDLAEEGAA